jgi:hypothetical protein
MPASPPLVLSQPQAGAGAVSGSSVEASKAWAGVSGSSQAQDEIQLCGGEWIKTTENGAVDEEALWALDKVRSTGLGVVAALSHGPTEVERATALWLLGLKERVVSHRVV